MQQRDRARRAGLEDAPERQLLEHDEAVASCGADAAGMPPRCSRVCEHEDMTEAGRSQQHSVTALAQAQLTESRAALVLAARLQL